MFQSAPPVWAATAMTKEESDNMLVSIRAARVGGDNAKPAHP